MADKPLVYGCAYCHCEIRDPERVVSIPYYSRSSPALRLRTFCSLLHAKKYDEEGPVAEVDTDRDLKIERSKIHCKHR
jgi:hypothetical protein